MLGVSGDCSLRQAIDKAQPGDTVALPGASDNRAVFTLTLGATLAVSKNLTIVGNGPQASAISGLNNLGGPSHQPFRILTVSGGTVALENLALENGVDGNDENFQNCGGPCETLNGNGGGALLNSGGNISLTDIALTNDSGSGTPVGGAVSNTGNGTLTMTDVSFTNDSAGFGGGLFVRSGTVNGTGITFENNGGGGFGGGAAYVAGGIVSLVNSTIVDNGSRRAWAAESTMPAGR